MFPGRSSPGRGRTKLGSMPQGRGPTGRTRLWGGAAVPPVHTVPPSRLKKVKHCLTHTVLRDPVPFQHLAQLPVGQSDDGKYQMLGAHPVVAQPECFMLGSREEWSERRTDGGILPRRLAPQQPRPSTSRQRWWSAGRGTSATSKSTWRGETSGPH
jgi:hypothetical protein